MSYGVYRATFDDDSEQLVKAESFDDALCLATETFRPKAVKSFELVREVKVKAEKVRDYGDRLKQAEQVRVR